MLRVASIWRKGGGGFILIPIGALKSKACILWSREGTLLYSRRPQPKVTLAFPATQTPLTSSKAYRSFLRIVLFKCIKIKNMGCQRTAVTLILPRSPLDLECWKNVKRQDGYLLQISCKDLVIRAKGIRPTQGLSW